MESQESDIMRSFSLLSRFGQRYIHHRIHQEGQHMGYSQARIMMLLHHGHVGKRQEHFTKLLKKDKGTIARAITKLEESGLIRRETDPKDHRAYHIYPTTKAETRFNHIETIMDDLEKLMLKEFTKEEKTTLQKLLKKMENNVSTLDFIPHLNDHHHNTNRGEKHE